MSCPVAGPPANEMVVSMTRQAELSAATEGALRRALLRVALGRSPADTLLRVGRLFDAGTGTWLEDAEIAIADGRIAFTGPRDTFPGTAKQTVERPGLAAVPGFGEVHKHIESSHITPDYEAALVIPRGTTWTCEASHELSNVLPERTVDFWLAPRRAGSPFKIFPLPGSAVPPTAWEHGAHLDGADMAHFLAEPSVAGLDEVMDWPALVDPENPAHGRLWSMIEATWAARGVVEGHGAGLRDLPRINAFAAAGLASDHEAWTAEEAWDKLRRGLFLEIRLHTLPEIVSGLLERGLRDWSQVALTTDDRSASETLRQGGTERNLRAAIDAGLPPETALQLVTVNPARHMRLHQWVGLAAPGRFADLVLLSDVGRVEIAEVWADGAPVARQGKYLPAPLAIEWPAWATDTIRVGRRFSAADFAIAAPHSGPTAEAALLRPFHWKDDFLIETLAAEDDQVLRDPGRNITKFAIVDRFSGRGAVSKMFWKGCGPGDAETALACSMGHDKHNVWCVGSSDAAMALAVNTLTEIGGGWALVHNGDLSATVRFEIAGLMTARPAEALDAEMQAFYAAAERADWMYEPSSHPRWGPGFPERLAFATLTCAPWRWQLVAPSEYAPQGLVNVATGETHPVVW